MIHVEIANTFLSIFRDAAGIAGNVFAFGFFLSPVPTFRRIVRNRSTEQFSGLPYIYALLNCLLTMWYGTPLISRDNILIVTVNSIGSIFQLVYIILFIVHAEKPAKLRTIGLLVGVLVLFAIVVLGTLLITDLVLRQLVAGLLSCAALVSMFASPLFIIKLVIRTKSVEFMPFYLSLTSFILSTSFFIYGFINFDPFVYIPNGIGTLLAIVQLSLFVVYRNLPRQQESNDPLIISYG